MRMIAFAAAVEAGTSMLLLLDPSLFVSLLLGAELSEAGRVLGRLAGITLLALVAACWPGHMVSGGVNPARRGLLVFSVLTTAFLVYLGLATQLAGPLLWPAAALHAVVSIFLARGAQG